MLKPLIFCSVAIFSHVALAQDAGPTNPSFDSNGDDAFPIVLTPTRLRQSLQDVPASVTIITAEMMRKFSIMNVPDALGMVPGMAVTQPSGSDYRINYHGTNVLTPRRMNVLIDGVSVYQPMYARVNWKNLPVVIDDIDRIEVTRGPDSASYGPNSMMAIVNIITKHPADVERAFVATTFGSLATVDVTGRVAMVIGPTSVRLTVNKHRDSGYDFLSRIGGDHDSTLLNRLNLRTQTRLSDSSTLDVDAAYAGGTNGVPFVEQFQTSFPDQTGGNFYLSGTLATSFSPQHQLQVRASYWEETVKQNWSSCMPTVFLLPEIFNLWRANPSYVNSLLAGRSPSGGTAADDALAALAAQAIGRLGPGGATALRCLTPNQNINQRRTDIEVQDTYVFSEQLRLVSGAGIRAQNGTSETFFGGSGSTSMWRVFGNAEYKPQAALTFNAGAYAEQDNLIGLTVSPRLGANFRLSNNQSLRLVWSQATRTPDYYEQRANWIYHFNDVSPPLSGSNNANFFQSATSPGGLNSERISSVEIGYLVNVPAIGMMFDAKLFEDRLTDLISEKLQVAKFQPTNSGKVRLTGYELQGTAELSADWTGFANFSYLINHHASTTLERTQYSKYSGGAGLSHNFGNGWSASFAYYGASADGPGQSQFGREDATISKSLQVGESQIRSSFILRRLHNKAPTYYRDTGSTPSSLFDNRLQLFGQVQVAF